MDTVTMPIRMLKDWQAELDAARVAVSACTGVEFTGDDPTGAVLALVEALQPLAVISELREIMPGFSWHDVIKDEHIRAACAALARVRMDAEKGE